MNSEKILVLMLYFALTMSKTNYAKCSNFFQISFVIIFIHFCTSAPVNVTENPYSQFIAELNRNKCSVPSQVQLPFDPIKENNFEYLSPYLEICQKTGSTKRNKEAVVLCKEIFDNIRNISCPTKTGLPDINENLSENICQDIGALNYSVPEEDKSLLKRLTDNFLCDIMCDSEFEKACQVLLWSFNVQKRIASVASAQEPEQPNIPEEGGDMRVDSFKQGNALNINILPEIDVNPENDKKNTEEAKNGDEADGIAEVPKPSKLVEKPVPNGKGIVLENHAVKVSESQDSTDASKPASSVKIPSSPAEQIQTSNLDSEDKYVEEITKGDSDDRIANKHQEDTTKHDEINTRVEFPQNSNSNVVTDDFNGNSLADTAVQYEKVINGYPQNNSYTPTNQNISVTGKDNISDSKIPNETPKKDKSSNLRDNNEQTSLNLVNTIAENKAQGTVSDDFKLGKKTDLPSTSSQTIKVTIQQQTVQEITRDESSIPRDETKIDQVQSNSASIKVQTQDYAQANTITDVRTMDPSTDQTKQKAAQQIEFNNTIPDTIGVSISTDKKTPEKSLKLKSTIVNPDGNSVTPNSLTETSTKTAAALEKMEGGSDLHQPVEEVDHYGDTENTEDDEYSRPEYDGGLYEVSKNKESNPDVPSPITAAKEIITDPNEKPIEFPSRNAFGQDLSDIQMISSFPEQEDSHFFFYFLSIVLILMAGYLIFHNKQKIIALIVEGRHERNRRSHRVGYKKLETK